MFRAKRVAESPALFLTSIGLLVAIVAATGVTVWLAYEVRKEHLAITALLDTGDVEAAERLGTFPGELRWQFVFSLLVLGVLLASAVVLVFVLRAYLASQESLVKTKRLAWDILASMDQAVLTTDCDGRITSLNPRCYDLLGIEPDLVGQPLEQACPDGASVAELSRIVLRLAQPEFDHDFSVVRNGQTKRLRAECHVLYDVNDLVLGTVLHVRDVTERVLIEDRMRRMERFLGLGSLAAGLHHEIKNPLGALSLHVQLLEEGIAADASDDVAEHLGVLKTEVTRIGGVLESFRDYASSEVLSQSETDVLQLVQRTTDLIRPNAERQGVRVILRRCERTIPFIHADPARLEQVMLNLAMNALKAMRDGGELSFSVSGHEKGVMIEVVDTGHGIPDTVLPRIFDPYFTTKNEGSGMGLAICDKIVRQHGGQIHCETDPSGTIFRISLPVDARQWPTTESKS